MPISSGQYLTPTHPGYVVGRYYIPPFYAGISSTSTGTNIICYSPVYFGQTIKINSLSCRVSTAASGGLANLGIYRNNAGLPGTFAIKGGAVTTSTSGIREIIFTAVQLNPGWYWLASLHNKSATWDAFASPISNGLIGYNVIDNTTITGLRADATYDAVLPDTAPITNLAFQVTTPAIWFRPAA